MKQTKKVFAYIDGFNFYHSLVKFIKKSSQSVEKNNKIIIKNIKKIEDNQKEIENKNNSQNKQNGLKKHNDNLIKKNSELIKQNNKLNLNNTHKSIDFRKLLKHFLVKGESLQNVYYFSAPPNHLDINKQEKHSNYTSDLKEYCNIKVVEGRFSKKDRVIKCSNCNFKNEFITYEEKKTDVSLAINIISDILSEDLDKVIIVSADTDFFPVVDYILNNTNKEIFVLLPPCSSSSKRRTHYMNKNKKTKYKESKIKDTYHIKTSQIRNSNKKYNP